jgi:hypothetical protein
VDHDDDPKITLRVHELLDVVGALHEVYAALPDAEPRERVKGIAVHLLLRIAPAVGCAPPTVLKA